MGTALLVVLGLVAVVALGYFVLHKVNPDEAQKVVNDAKTAAQTEADKVLKN